MTLLIATPVRAAELFAASVSLGYAESRTLLAQRMAVEFLDPALIFSCELVRARNRVAAMVLRELPHVDRVLWWDDDEWPRDVGIVQRMLDTGEDFLAGPYTTKSQPIRWVHTKLDDDPPPDERGMLRIKRCGFGFTLTSRRCLEMVSSAYMTDATHPPYWDLPHENLVPNVFGQRYGEQGGRVTLLSEDHSFCDRWRDIGGEIWMYGGHGNIIEHAGPHAWDATQMMGAVVR